MFMTKTGVFQFRELDKRRAMAIGIRNEHHIVLSNNALTGPSIPSMRGCKAERGMGREGGVGFVDATLAIGKLCSA